MNVIRSLTLLAMCCASGNVVADERVDFTNDIVPVITKLGCNTGSCHGSAAGRGGFKLSLYGGDPASDFDAMVHQWEGRRVNIASPENSLILLKPTESIAHGGGYLIDEDSEAYRLLRTWIEQGPSNFSPRSLQQVRVSPSKVSNLGVGGSVELQVTASFDDETARDVTRWTVFSPEDDTSVSIDEDSHRLTVHRRGRHLVVARYLNQVIPIEIIAPLNDDFEARSVPSHNWIDDFVTERLNQMHLPASGQATDEQWVRRVSLDLTGRLPIASDVHPDGLDRRQYLDRLMSSESFVEYWTFRIAKWLRVGSRSNDPLATHVYHEWLSYQLRDNVGYDEMVRSLLVSSGDTQQVGPANFYRTVAGPREQAELFSEVFMGSRLRCANCHHHPLDRWTQEDYHGLAAIFANVQMDQTVKVIAGGEVIHPATLEPAVVRIPGIVDPLADNVAIDAREQLAGWLIDPNNPYFARVVVNRLWDAMMGRGIVDPPDDFRSTNPPTHPELLDALAHDFVDHGYSIRRTLRLIAESATYSRSSVAVDVNALDEAFYSRSLPRPLSAEVLADAISDVLGVALQYGDEPLGTRAVTLASPMVASKTLDILGRCSAMSTCESQRGGGGGLKQQLHLLNGELLNVRIDDPRGRLAMALRSSQDPMQIVEQFYFAALHRAPTGQEISRWQQALDGAETKIQHEILEDFVWALLCCDEFITNH